MKQIVILNIIETCAILKEHGMKISPEHLRAGIECGAYPFGVAIRMKQPAFEIYRPLLMKWIAERSDETQEREATC